MAHGFGSGLGFFYRNIDDLLNSGKVGRVIGVDWLGMGGSARVGCWQSPIRSIFSRSNSSKLSFCNSKYSTSDAIGFFLDPLHQLLHDNNLFRPREDIWLVGHSLGGYLAARYAMRLNQIQNENDTSSPNLSKIILASPVGFQAAPAAHERIPSTSLPPAFRIVDALWSANFTPQALVRAMGSTRGKNAIKRALHGRIPHLNQSASTNSKEKTSELDLLADYLYHVTVAPASGEYAMNSLLEPAASEEGAGVYAREPLGPGLMASDLEQSSLQSVKILFGDHDWMRFNETAARQECDFIRNNCNISADVHIIPKAGHHLYLDNSSSFLRHILDD
jgi:cardiolipin-specific phospholipase